MFWLRKLFCFQCKSSSVFCSPLSSTDVCTWLRSPGASQALLFSTSHLPSTPCKLMQTPFLPPVAELFRLPGQGLKQCQPLPSQSYC
uniref:Secreted protein n=2 Tax=Pan TaxID=9596 RepID=A0A2I3T248_PANTR